MAALFQSIRFRLNIENDDFVQFEGVSPDEVKIHYDNQRTIFSFNVLNAGKRKLIKIDPFNQTCIGVETAHKYTVHLSMVRVDFAKVILLAGGLLLFFYARTLSQTPLFYYLTGIFLGIFASFLVVVYFGSKLFPKVSFLHKHIGISIDLLTPFPSTETNDVRYAGWRMDSWNLFSANALRKFAHNISGLPVVCVLVCDCDWFLKFCCLLSTWTTEKSTI